MILKFSKLQSAMEPLRLNHSLAERIPGATLKLTPLPSCPTIDLLLLDPSYPQWALTQQQAAALMEKPPYWSFCWASGQVLASYLLANPDLVRGKVVADVGSGSGVVAIAAKLAGAKTVIACDQDPDAIEACLYNAKLNRCPLQSISSLDQLSPVDTITVADVFYDRDNLTLLPGLLQRCKTLLVADSRLNGEELAPLHRINSYRSHTVPDLDESSEFRNVTIYCNQSSVEA